MVSALITGGAGYFGGVLKDFLTAKGVRCTVFDLLYDPALHGPSGVRGDLRRPDDIEECFRKLGPFDYVFHVAAELAHESSSSTSLWDSNVEGTRNIAQTAIRHGVKKLVFTSTNCLWGKPLGRPVREDDPPCPAELYGESKREGERILLELSKVLPVTIIRCPTIVSAGRLGLLTILFDFIRENRPLWVVGGGGNRYQFIYALDLAEACWKSAQHPATAVYHVGSDDVKTFREVYRYLIDNAGSRSPIRAFPKSIAIPLLRLFHILRLSPLGPYHYKMIAENFVFDTTRIKKELGWRPTRTNEEILLESYRFYVEQLKRGPEAFANSSPHSHPARMGIIALLKWLP